MKDDGKGTGDSGWRDRVVDGGEEKRKEEGRTRNKRRREESGMMGRVDNGHGAER